MSFRVRPSRSSEPRDRGNRRSKLRRLQRLTTGRLASLASSRLRLGTYPAAAAGTAAQSPKRLRYLLGSTSLTIVLILLVVVGRRYAAIDIERTVRNQVIPALEAQIGQKIEVGRVESDYVSQVTLYDIVVGRNKSLPRGALLRAKKAIVTVDVVGLALRRVTALEAITSVVIFEPDLFVERDSRGSFNIMRLFKRGAGPGRFKWTGTFTVHDGRLLYKDYGVRAFSGALLVLDSKGIEATATFQDDNDVDLNCSVAETEVGQSGTTLRRLAADGSVALAGDWLQLNVSLPRIPAPLLADYGFRRGEVVATAGAVAGQLHFAWDALQTVKQQWLASGDIALSNVDAVVRVFKDPTTGEPLQIFKADGPLAFRDMALSTTGVTATALNTPVHAAGRFVLLPSPVLDLELKSDAADTTRLLRLLPAQTLQGAVVKAGLASGSVHLTGDQKVMRARGNLDLPDVFIQQVRLGKWRSPKLLATFDSEGSGPMMRVAANFTSPQLKGSLPGEGQWHATGIGGSLSWGNDVSPPRLEVALTSDQAGGQHPRIGDVRTRSLHLKLATDGELSRVAAEIDSGESLVDGQLTGRWRAGSLRAVLQGRPDRAAKWSGEVTASGVRGSHKTQGDVQAAALHAVLEYPGGGDLDIKGKLIAASVASPRLGRFKAGVLRGDIAFTHAEGRPRVAARFDAGDTGASAAWGSWGATRVRGQLRVFDSGAGGRVAGDIMASGFVGQSGRYGRVRSSMIRLVTVVDDLARPRFDGVVVVSRTDLSRINLNTLSPEMARRVRDIGVVDGSLRFADLDPLSGLAVARAEGDLRLTHLTLFDERTGLVPLSRIQTHTSLRDGVLYLGGATAQSPYGPLSADLTLGRNVDLSNLRLSFSTEMATFDAARLNPYLAAQGLSLEGIVKGRIAVTSQGATPLTLDTQFDLSAPVGLSVRGMPAGQATGLVRGTRLQLRGQGRIRFADRDNWNFTGNTTVIANAGALEGGVAQVAHRPPGSEPPFAVPEALLGTRASRIRISSAGSLSMAAGSLEPRLAGTVEVERLVLPGEVADEDDEPIRTIAARSGSRSEAVNLQDARLDYVWQGGSVGASRIFARVAGGTVDGHVSIGREGSVEGQFLAQRVDPSQATEIFASYAGEEQATSIRRLEPRGSAFIKADVKGTVATLRTNVQAQLYKASVRLQGATVPLDMVQADVSLNWPFAGVVPIRQLVVWSNGGRFAMQGSAEAEAGEINLELNATVNDARLNILAQFPGLVTSLRALQQNAELDGLLSGQFHITGSASQPQADGRMRLRLARVAGINIDSTTANIAYTTEGGGPRLAIGEVAGKAEGASFTGAVNVDLDANQWRLDLKTTGAPTDRLLQIVGSARRLPVRELPLRGELEADIHLAGALRAENADDPAGLLPRTGTVLLKTNALHYRGRPLGMLTADLALENGVLKARTVELLQSSGKESDQGAPGDATSEKTPNALVQVKGDLPITADAPQLNAKVSASNETLAFVIQSLADAQRTLRESGRRIIVLDRLLTTARSLPASVEARVGIEASLTGQWSSPRIEVSKFTVREARYDAERTLPTIDAAFTYADGGLTVQQAEVRLLSGTPEKEDTVLRLEEGGAIAPDGTVNLVADVVNANLSQLAAWVPALRDEDGRPVLLGQLSQFTFQVRGTTEDPTVNGSLLAENLNYNGYTLDRLFTRFDIGNGFVEVLPGNLTVVKGNFQSSVAWGRVPWSWGLPGPQFDAPMEVHLPLQKRDFGALAGVLIPAVTNVEVDEFEGSIDVAGTLDRPLLAGKLKLKEARFRVDPAALPLNSGIRGFSGTVNFVNGNRLVIDPDDPIRGSLAPASEVSAPSTGNPSAAERNLQPRRSAAVSAPDLKGRFLLRGNVSFDPDPQNFTRPRATASRHRYDLELSLADVGYSTSDISGVRDAALGVIWRTGPGEPEKSQHLRWMMVATDNAKRRKERKGTALGGRAYSVAAVTLSPNFAESYPALMRSRIEEFAGLDDFKAMDVYQRLASLPDVRDLKENRSRLQLQGFGFNVKNVGTGILDGTLYLDNRPVSPNPLGPLRRQQRPVTPSLTTELIDPNHRRRGQFVTPLAAHVSDQAQSDASRIIATQADVTAGPAGRIRVSGTVVLSQAELTAIPAGSPGRSGLAPAAPVIDVRLELGEDVRFSTVVLRAEMEGGVNISGTPRELSFKGRFTARNGQVRFPNAPARLTTAEITVDTVQGEPRVEIDATASSRVGRYNITLRMHGPLEIGNETTQTLVIDVSSDPPLSQDEVFKQLLGLSVVDGSEVGSGDANKAYARAVVSLLSSTLFGQIESSLQQALGLDAITFEYHMNEALAFEVGKAIGDRIYVTYKRSLGSPSGQRTPFVLRIEYRIKGNLQLGLQVDELNRKRIMIEKSWRF